MNTHQIASKQSHMGPYCLKYIVHIKISNACKIYSNKKETSDFHGTVSYDPVKISQQK